MANYYKAEGIIIKSLNYAEADKFLTIFTKEYGKISVLARGVRKIKSKNRGSVQPFTRSEIMLTRSKKVDVLTQCQLIESFLNINVDLDKLTYAIYFGELLYRLLPEREENKEIYNLLWVSLKLLEEVEPFLVARFFETKLLIYLGYKPELDNCVSCLSENLGGKYFFSFQEGGLICSDCLNLDRKAISITGETRAILKQLTAMSPGFLGRLKLSKNSKLEMEKVLTEYIIYNLGDKVNSLDFLNSLQDWQGTPNF